MKRYILNIGLIIATFCISSAVLAQDKLPKSNEKEELLSSGSYYVPDATYDYTGKAYGYTIRSGASVTIDLNGQTIKGGSEALFNVVNGTLRIIDTSEGKTGKMQGTRKTCFYLSCNTQSGAKVILNLEGGTIEDCQPSNGEGGAVEVERLSGRGSVTFNMYGGTITGCRASQGAGVYVHGGIFNMYGGTITNNKIFSLQRTENSNWQSHSDDDNKLPDGINSNYSYSGGGSLVTGHREYRGGGVFVSTGTFNMYGGTISENVSVNGGGVYVTDNGTFNLYGGTIENNYAASLGFDYGNGGGVYLSKNAKFVINGDYSDSDDGIIIRHNKVTRYGGGIYVDNSSLTVTNATIADNFASSGAGVAQYGTAGITLNKCIISNNHALVQGKDTVDVGGAGVFSNSTGGLTISGSQIIGNTSTKYGAGMYLGGGTFTIDGTSSISGNKATAGNGGGVYMANGTFNIRQSGILTADNNDAIYGGVIYMTGGNVNVDGAFYAGLNESNNSAKSGGAIYMGNGTFTVTGTAAFNSNNATSGDGGGVYLGGGTFKVASNGTVNLGAAGSGNSASGNGGGLYCAGTFEVTGKAVVSHNTAANGGGVCVSNGSVSLAAGSLISNNTASSLGGGLYVVNTTSTKQTASFNGGTFTGNEANSGGAVASVGSITLSLAATMEGNTARNGNGGGIYMANGVDMTFGDGLIRNNNALAPQGSTYVTASGKDASDVAGAGGGIFMASRTSLSFTSTEMGIYNNVATNAGADICANGSSTTINLPNITKMNLKGFDVIGNELYWVEDYFTGESYGTPSKIGLRYEDALKDPSINLEPYIVNIADTETSKTMTEYICLDLGYDLVFVKLFPIGLKDGDNAAIIMSYPEKIDGEPTGNMIQYRKVLISGGIEKRIVGLPSGDWNFKVTPWDFKYNDPTFNPGHDTNGYIKVTRGGTDKIEITFTLKEGGEHIDCVKSHEHKKVNRMTL